MSLSTINWTNMSNPIQLLEGANTNSGGFFFPVSYFMFILILFMSMLGFGAEVAGVVALFVALPTGIMLVYLGLISLSTLAVPLGILLFLMIYIFYSSSKTQG